MKQISQNGFENTALKFSISDSASDKGNLGWINLNILSKKVNNAVKILNMVKLVPIIQPNSILILS